MGFTQARRVGGSHWNERHVDSTARRVVPELSSAPTTCAAQPRRARHVPPFDSPMLACSVRALRVLHSRECVYQAPYSPAPRSCGSNGFGTTSWPCLEVRNSTQYSCAARPSALGFLAHHVSNRRKPCNVNARSTLARVRARTARFVERRKPRREMFPTRPSSIASASDRARGRCRRQPAPLPSSRRRAPRW
jgi:hypothetical protein